jgi:hypothetical protein
MQFIESLKNKIGDYLLLTETIHDQTKRSFTSLEDALEIGIIYNGLEREDEAMVHQYANQLRSEGKKVFLMGYVDLKSIPGNKKFSLQSEYFCKEKLDFFNLPNKGKIGQFLKIEFDLLLSIYTEPLLPMRALSAYAHAKYRVGPMMNKGTHFFEAMIDTGSDKSLRFLIDQIDFYLRNI